MQYITKRITGDCPETGRIQSVEVKFTRIAMAGMATPGYKPSNYRCDYASEYGCSCKGPDGRDCPLFKKAAQTNP